MKYRKILLAYNGSQEGKRALFEAAYLAAFLQAETHLLAVASMLIAAHTREPVNGDPGTTTVVAAAVCYLLGALVELGDATLAGALGIGVAALRRGYGIKVNLSDEASRHLVPDDVDGVPVSVDVVGVIEPY